LVGGGLRARPGEISLAHNGVLFLDELPEFSAQVLDSLRQPLETGDVAIARVNHRITDPARFMLVAAMNPCRCGRANDPGFACRRGPNTRCVAEYQSRLSGPLLDRERATSSSHYAALGLDNVRTNAEAQGRCWKRWRTPTAPAWLCCATSPIRAPHGVMPARPRILNKQVITRR
jgi:hypothetical protein